METIGKDRAYVEGIKKLHELISRKYSNGGWLPPGRQMCKKFGISHLTYRKALQRLTQEGATVSFPRKGHYVNPVHLRTRKIGMVIRDGEEFPFIDGASMIFAAAEYLEQENFLIQQIQASPINTLFRKTLSHAGCGLLWFYPSDSVWPVIEKIHNGINKGVLSGDENLQGGNKNIPVLVVDLFDPLNPDGMNRDGVPCVRMDLHHLGAERANFLLERGHKNIAYIGNYWFAEYTGFTKILKDSGVLFSPASCINDISEITVKLPKMISSKKITAIVSEGSEVRLDKVFQVLSAIPEDKQPELLLRYNRSLKPLYQKYPNVKPAMAGRTDIAKIGKAAGKLLAGHLNNGTPLSSISVPAFSITQTREEGEEE